MQFTRCKYLFF